MTPLPKPHPIIVFDGECRLCIASLRFVENRDRHQEFRYVPFQSAAGRVVMERLAMDPAALDSFVLLEQGRAFAKSAAWSRILLALAFPWSWWGWGMRLVPTAIGDHVYDFVGRHRLSWFGRNETCVWPAPDDPLGADIAAVHAALDGCAPGKRSPSGTSR